MWIKFYNISQQFYRPIAELRCEIWGLYSVSVELYTFYIVVLETTVAYARETHLCSTTERPYLPVRAVGIIYVKVMLTELIFNEIVYYRIRWRVQTEMDIKYFQGFFHLSLYAYLRFSLRWVSSELWQWVPIIRPMSQYGPLKRL
jgi:hypothetical protein